MSLPRIVHLVDDTTAGGVMRVLDHILTAPEMAQTADHALICIDRGRISLRHIKADVIVSHLAVSWRAMPMLAALRARHPRTPLVHVEHSYTEAFVAANVTHKWRFATLLRMAYRLFDQVVAVSQAQGQWLIQSGSVRASALTVIASCVDLSAFRALCPARSPVRAIGAIGRLDRQKGFDTLIMAFRRISRPDIFLHIYGEGCEGVTLRDLAGNDPRIRFMGFCPDPVAAMGAVDVVAMPSNWEAYGLVAIEALAAGRGLLVNNIDGLVDHVAHGAHAVAENSVEEWQTALEKVMQDGAGIPDSRSVESPHLENAFSGNWQELVNRMLGKHILCNIELT
jgi:glycosyltransferase involved in cell wall biosynthesis